jgi:peptide/nickel transport system substrate-binding protein
MNPLLTVHPLAKQVQRYALLTTLVRYDSALRVMPYLAHRWAWSADRKTLTFYLVPDLRWHDGAPTTSRDVAWTLTAARAPASGYPRAVDLRGVEAIRAEGDTAVAVTFSAAEREIPDVFTDLAILPAHLLDTVPLARMASAGWNVHPVGNGPFRFVLHEPNRRWVFDANSDFPTSLGGPPQLRRLVISVVDEPATKLTALTSGELDLAGIQPAHAAFVARNPELRVIDYPLLFSYALVFNTRRPLFRDRAVRQAVGLAIDRRELVDGVAFGYARPASGPLEAVPGKSGDNENAVPLYAPARARGLLGGRSLDFELVTVGSGEAALEQLIQSQLAKIGIRVRIRQLELSAFLARVNPTEHAFDAAVIGLPGDLGVGQAAAVLDLAGLHGTGDREHLLAMVADSVPAAFLYHARGLQGMNRRVHGVQMDWRGELPTLHEWTTAP